MSISTVVSRGYGSWSNVNFVPTRGYKPGTAPPSVGSIPGPGDGDNDKKRLKAKIDWLQKRKKLREKERRQLALYKHLLTKEEASQEKLLELPLPVQPVLARGYLRPEEKIEALQLFSKVINPDFSPYRGNAIKSIKIDLADEDEEGEEWILMGDE